jgi:hypothetical protein
MANPTVILVGADKGGVGKTTVTRALLDYFVAHGVPVRAFDTESPRGTLKRFFPDLTEVVDLATVPDQMKVFDTLDAAEGCITVIDIRAGLLSPTLRMLRDIGFIEAARKGQFTFTLFHILGPALSSLAEIAETAAYLADSHHVLVKNFINNTSFFEWDPETHAGYFRRVRTAAEITIPKLDEMACEQVELASVPYFTFVSNKTARGEPAQYSFVLRGYVRHWLGHVWSAGRRSMWCVRRCIESARPSSPAC